MGLFGYVRSRNTLPRLFGALLILYLVLEYLVKARTFAALVALLVVVIGLFLAVRLIRNALGKAIWRLRNRLIVTYVFIGVVPVVLILALAVLGTWIVVGQVAVYMVNSELDRRASSLVDPARILSQARASDRAAILQQMGSFLASRMPGFQMIVAGDQELRYPPQSTIQANAGAWKDYTGYVAREGVYYSAAVARNKNTTVIALAPITRDVLEKIVPGIGALNLVTEREGSIGLNGRAGTLPAPFDGLAWLDFPTLGIDPIPYADLNHPDVSGTAYLSVVTRPSAALGAVFGKGLEIGQAWLLGFVAVACTLLLVELVSFVIGLSLTRTITLAVHKLYEGTLQISKGNFSWRVPVKGVMISLPNCAIPSTTCPRKSRIWSWSRGKKNACSPRLKLRAKCRTCCSLVQHPSCEQSRSSGYVTRPAWLRGTIMITFACRTETSRSRSVTLRARASRRRC